MKSVYLEANFKNNIKNIKMLQITTKINCAVRTKY